MNIITVHNYYSQRGGEEEVFESETSMLRSYGHQVSSITVESRAVRRRSLLRAAARTVWSPAAARKVREAIRTLKPDLIHAHNLFPLLSPSVVAAAKAYGVPIVVTLHNYRLACIRADLFRDGGPCEDCLAAGHSGRAPS